MKMADSGIRPGLSESEKIAMIKRDLIEYSKKELGYTKKEARKVGESVDEALTSKTHR